MRLTVLGGCGAWPAAGSACGGFLLEHNGFRLLIDPGYAVVPRLLQHIGAAEVDAVYVSHGHPDHCADLNPLLRARAFVDNPAGPLPVYAPPGALDIVLQLDQRSLAGSYELHEFVAGERFDLGPFQAETRLLPHWLPNAGLRLSAGGLTLAYTGDSGPSLDIVDLARNADVLLAEASFVDVVPEDAQLYLSSARQCGEQATVADVGRLLLTHLMPGTDPAAALAAATSSYQGRVDIASGGFTLTM